MRRQRNSTDVETPFCLAVWIADSAGSKAWIRLAPGPNKMAVYPRRHRTRNPQGPSASRYVSTLLQQPACSFRTYGCRDHRTSLNHC